MPEALISLILFASISTLSPGGATTLATASGMQFGYVKSLPLILGIAVGLSTLVASSATGLAALLLAVPEFSLAIKAIGSIYLLWLAFKIGRAGAPQAGAGSASSPIGFFGGLALLVINPKAWAMAFGASASFSAISSSPLVLALTMAMVFAACCIMSLSLWSLGGALLARTLKTAFQWRVLNIILALLLVLSIVPFWI